MKCKVFKLSKNESNFRTPLEHLDEIIDKPVEGLRLFIGSSTHESGGIMTSVVNKVRDVSGGYEVETENSTYLIILE